MMKYSQYSTYPEKIIQYDKNSYLINYDIEESTQIEEEKELKIYKCKYIIVPKLNKEEIVNALIREQYSKTQELNILRKSEGEDFYNLQQYTKKANIIADKILNPEDELLVCALYTRRGGINICPARFKNLKTPDKNLEKLFDLSTYCEYGINLQWSLV